MSSFMCSPRTIGKVLRVMERRYTTFSQYPPLAWSNLEQQQMALQLVLMNDQAMSARYNKHDQLTEEEATDLALLVALADGPASNLELLKAMDCYLYQCNEGSIGESAFYTRVSAERGRLANEILTSLPEYDAAPWGDA